MDRANQILQLIHDHPGIRFSEMMRETGLKNGVLSYHLSKIEQSGKIQIERTPRVARLYPCGMQKEETVIIKHLKNPTARKILTELSDNMLSFKELVDRTKKSQGTVSLCLKSLCADEIIERVFVGGNMMFNLATPSMVNSLIDKQKPTFIENTANNISDIFSSI